MALSIKELDYIVDGVVEGITSRLNKANDVLSTEQVAGMLGISRRAVTKRARDGKLPGKKKGKYYYFSKNDIIRLLTK